MGANKSGNQVRVARRITYAVLAAALVADRYKLDRKRIYLAGFSGGARVSGLVAANYPDLFRGAVYMGGAEVWGDTVYPATLASMQRNRYAFLVGGEDHNRSAALAVQTRYEDAGIAATNMKIIRRVGHVLPEARHMISALKFLDGAGD